MRKSNDLLNENPQHNTRNYIAKAAREYVNNKVTPEFIHDLMNQQKIQKQKSEVSNNRNEGRQAVHFSAINEDIYMDSMREMPRPFLYVNTANAGKTLEKQQSDGIVVTPQDPYGVALERFNDLYQVSDMILWNGVSDPADCTLDYGCDLQTMINNRMNQISESIILSTFTNGLLSVVKPYIIGSIPAKIITEQPGMRRNLIPFRMRKTKPNSMDITHAIGLHVARTVRAVADNYYDFVNTLVYDHVFTRHINNLVDFKFDLKRFCKEIAVSLLSYDQDFNEIPEEAYDTLAVGVLLELARVDCLKISELIEINAVNAFGQYQNLYKEPIGLTEPTIDDDFADL